jgi:hypothetical protein
MNVLMEHRDAQTQPTARAITAPAPAVLLRLRVDGGDWSDHVPPVPEGHDVSVSFTSRSDSARHAAALRELGFRLVPLCEAGDGGMVDVLLREGVVEQHPRWWRAMASLAERAYPLALGPAAKRWHRLVTCHDERRG